MYFQSLEYIFLDVGYTLCYPKSGDWWYTSLFIKLADGPSFKEISDDRKNTALAKADEYLISNHTLKTQKEEYKQNIEVYSIIANNMPELSLSSDDIEMIAYDRAYNMKNYVFYDGVKELVAWLSSHFKVGVISDAWPSTVNMLKYAGLWDYLDTCTLSCDIGIRKPHPEIYEKAIADAKIDPRKTIYVDDIESNLVPAYNMGIHPVKIRTVDKSNSRFDVIDSITDLKHFIEEKY